MVRYALYAVKSVIFAIFLAANPTNSKCLSIAFGNMSNGINMEIISHALELPGDP